MTLKRLGRAVIVAVSLAVGGAGSVFGHSLPDSVLKFWHADEHLKLSITLPMENLVIAEPGLKALSDVSFGQDLDDDHLDLLEAYFSKHLALERQQKIIPVALTRARLSKATNEHVGEHILLDLEWVAQSDLKGSNASLTLIYDAVMHEVRNHRAIVVWAPDASGHTRLAEFGYHQQNGAPVPIILQLPLVEQ